MKNANLLIFLAHIVLSLIFFSNKGAADEAMFPLVAHEENWEKFIKYKEDGENFIGYIYIGDRETAISESTWLYVKQALNYYKDIRPVCIILELDTPGGEVFPAQKISDALQEMDVQHDIPIVAFINNWAISAGAMLAYSCRFITTVKSGSMGAAEPVLMGELGKMESASEKINSALRADFSNRARFFDRNPLIAEAMVDKDILLVLRDGKVVKLDNTDEIRKDADNKDVIISPKGKLLTLTSEEMLKYGVADQILLPEKLPVITEEENKKGEWPLSKTLLSEVPALAKIPQAVVRKYEMDWKTKFFVFLATPIVSSLLLMGLVIGGYMEMNHPGLGFPGIIAGASLFLMILSYFSLEISGWLEAVLILTGLALVLIEIFFVPSFGLLGVLGALLFLIGLVAMLVPELKSIDFKQNPDTWGMAGDYILKRLAWLGGAFFLSLGIIVFLARYFVPSFPGFQRFVLSGNEQDISKGYIAGYNSKELPPIGSKGVALSPLRPAGKVTIDGQIYDAISVRGFIDAGSPIVIKGQDSGGISVDKYE